MTKARTLTIEAPAKLNLGLEILDRRPDGYHEISSVLSMVEITDELTFTCDSSLAASHIEGVPGVSPSDNLIMRAIEAFNARAGTGDPVHVRAMKRIPAPAGLGSASSNAAATLIALNRLHQSPLGTDDLADLASVLGSDVPFFLGSPTALVSGTGTTLAALPNPSGWVVIVVPQIDLIAKTQKLYGMITPDDYSSGASVQQVASALLAGEPIPVESLSNAFEQPLTSLMPYVRKVIRVMIEAGCANVALSGAGPAHYSVFADESSARNVRKRLQPLLGSHDYVIAAPFRHAPLSAD